MELTEKAGRLKVLGPASVCYALFFTFCCYENEAGILIPFLAAGTLLYFWQVNRVTLKEAFAGRGWVLPLFIFLFGVSTCMTDSEPLILLNWFMMFFLLLIYMLRFYYPQEKWGVGRHLLSVLKAVCGAVGCLFAPIGDLAAGGKCREERKGGRRSSILLGILLAIPLLIVILVLLSFADAVFGEAVNRLFKIRKLPDDLPGILLMAAFAFFASYCGMVYLQKKEIAGNDAEEAKGQTLPALIAAGSIFAVYAIFSAVQIVYLFLHSGTLPEGMTYASYAHQGFYQLLAVCILTLVLTLVCTEHVFLTGPLRIVLTGIGACTYIMLASAAYRMALYVSAYDLTFLRLFVFFALLVVAVFMAGVMVSIYRKGFPLFSFFLAAAVSLYLLFSFLHPDYWIAAYNLAAGNADTAYLEELSADAVPAFSGDEKLMQEIRGQMEERISTENKDFRKFNFSRAAAEGSFRK